jgi:1-carboxybiuret hydrolase subunit AtzG-like
MKPEARRKATPKKKKKAIPVKRRVRPAAKRPPGRSAQVNDQRHDPVEGLMIAGARALNLAIDPAWHDSVAFNLRLVLDHAARVEAFSLPDDVEPAPVFYA